MSYYLNLKPTKEAIENLKKDVWLKKENIDALIAETRHKILIQCLSDNSIDDIAKLSRELTFALKNINIGLKSKAVLSAIDRYEEGDLYYNGWQYSSWGDNMYSDEDINYTLQSAIEDLLVLAIVAKADYFDDNEKFYEKWNKINERIDGYIEVMSEQATYQIINELKDFIEKEEDNVILDDDSDNDIPQNTQDDEEV